MATSKRKLGTVPLIDEKQTPASQRNRCGACHGADPHVRNAHRAKDFSDPDALRRHLIEQFGKLEPSKFFNRTEQIDAAVNHAMELRWRWKRRATDARTGQTPGNEEPR